MTDTEPTGAEAEVGRGLCRGSVAHQERGGVAFGRDAIVTLAVTAIAFAAFDDITTGNETDLRQEYLGLLVCLMWFIFVSVRQMRLPRRRHPPPRRVQP